MADAKPFYRPGPWLQKVLGPFAWRPRLTSGIGLGLLLMAALSLIPNHMNWSSRAVLSWDVGCLWFIVLILQEMHGQGEGGIRARAAVQDEGQGLILALVLIAATASLAAVGLELSLAKDDHGLVKACRVAAAVSTVALSWFVLQIIFALHYAHEYYAPDQNTPDDDDVIGGLDFPGGQPPDYWDFLHFAVVIGVASQTADIAFTSKNLRRIGTVHAVVSFVFNTAVLALTINLVAGLF